MNQFNNTMQSIRNINNFFSDLQEDIGSNCCDGALSLGGYCMECGEHAVPASKRIKVLAISPTIQIPVTVSKEVTVNGKLGVWVHQANPKSTITKRYGHYFNEEREEAMRGNY